MSAEHDVDEEFLAAKLAEVVHSLARLAGMDAEEVWDRQFEGRSVAIIESDESLRAELSDPDADGTIRISYEWRPS